MIAASASVEPSDPVQSRLSGQFQVLHLIFNRVGLRPGSGPWRLRESVRSRFRNDRAARDAPSGEKICSLSRWKVKQANGEAA
jgi:hypothetical protein